MNRLVDFGAPEEVAYISNPHLGSNKIRALISKITDYLRENNHEIRYQQKVDGLIYEGNQVVGVKIENGNELYSDHVIFAAGHSAHEVYYHLEKNNVAMKQKDFAVGVRIEHFRRDMDKMQFGNFAAMKIWEPQDTDLVTTIMTKIAELIHFACAREGMFYQVEPIKTVLLLTG